MACPHIFSFVELIPVWGPGSLVVTGSLRREELSHAEELVALTSSEGPGVSALSRLPRQNAVQVGPPCRSPGERPSLRPQKCVSMTTLRKNGQKGLVGDALPYPE